MKITFKDGITVEITEYENQKEAMIEAKRIHKEFLEDKKFRDSFRIRDNKSVVKRHIYDSYEDATDYIDYLEKLLDRKEINYSNIYLDEDSDKIILEFNDADDTQTAFDLILNENAAEKQDLDLDKVIGQISIKLNK